MNFRNKYRRDNDLLTAPRPMPEEIAAEGKRGGSTIRPITRIAAAAVAACMVLAAVAALPALMHRGRDLPLVETVSMGDLETAADYSEIYRAICDMNTYQAGYGVLTDGAAGFVERAESFNDVMFDTEEPMTAPTMKEPNSMADDLKGSASEPAAGEDSYSATNTQKQNVDEADIIKTDGQYIYRLTGKNIVIIDPFDMTVVSTLSPLPEDTTAEQTVTAVTGAEGSRIEPAFISFTSSYIRDFYVSGDRLAVMYSRSESDYAKGHSEFCGVMVYDITDPSAPVLLGDCAQSGGLLESRLIGDYVYIISNYYVYSVGTQEQTETYVPSLEAGGVKCTVSPEDISILPEASTPSYSLITSVDLRSGSSHADSKASFGCGGTVYADTERFVLCFPRHETSEEETVIDGKNVTLSKGGDSTLLVSYSINEGSVAQLASCTLPGHLLNQFSLDRHNGVLRVVTTLSTWEQRIWTDGIDRHEYEDSTSNALYTLDDGMNIIGRLEGLAEDERVYSVRFQGDMGYFVTFRQVDPLYAVDLSDPAAPEILSALKIPGFSQYMHPFAPGLMLGLGMDADEDTGATKGLKLSMFDISDPADVTESHKLIFSDIWWSEALSNHKAVVVSAQRDIIAFPLDRGGYIICGYSEEKGFYERYRLELDGWSPATRGLYIDDYFYICTETTLYRYDMTSFKPCGELEFAEIDHMGFILVD